MKKINPLLLLFILLLIVISISSVIFAINTQKQSLSKNNPEETALTKNFVVNQEISISDDVKLQIHKTLTDIYYKNIPYTENNLGTPMYTTNLPSLKNGSGLEVTLAIDVMQYYNGMVITEGYEGFRSLRRVGDEVTQLINAKEGSHILENVNSDNSYYILNTIIYPDKLSYIDGYFPPSASYDRQYFLVDQKNKQLITFLVSVRGPSKSIDLATTSNICYQDKCAMSYQFNNNAQKVFDEVESTIKEFLTNEKK